jgi:glycosyltransferase involved in cell wall biosynthesis
LKRKPRVPDSRRPLRVFVYEPYPLGKIFGNLRTLLYILQFAPADSVHCVVAVPFETELANHARTLGADWMVLAPPDAINRYGGKVLRDSLMGRVRAAAGMIGYNLRVRRVLRDQQIDVVYCSSIRALLTVGFGAKLAGVPCVWYVKSKLENGLLDRLGFWMADRIHFFCEANRDERYPLLVRWFKRKIDVVHIGLDLRDVDLTETHGSSLDDELQRRGGPAIGYVGQLYAPKGIHFLVEAFARVAPQFPDATLYLMGDPGIPEYAPYIGDLRERIRACGLESRVVFTGWRTDVLAIVNRMTVLVHPSLAEGFGRAVLEAMALGKPVIASRVGGLREAIRDEENGFLVAPGDVDAIADRLRRLLGDPELRMRIGARARATVRAEFQVEDKMQQLFSIWRDVARRSPPASAEAGAW